MRPGLRIFEFLPILFALLFSAAAFTGAGAAPHADSVIGVDDFWNLVESTRRAVNDLKGETAETIRAGLDDLAAQWETITAVKLQNGETLPLDNAYLLSALRAETPNLPKITAALDALLAARADYPRARFTGKDLQPLKEILARPEFQYRDEPPNPISEWLQKLWDRFAAWLDKLFPERDAAGEVSGESLPIWTWLSAILLALIIAYVFRGLFADLVAEAKLDANSGADEVLTAEAAFQRAQSLSRGRDYRAAVRYLYLSSLLLLDERGLLRYDRTRTNREVLRSVSDQPELSRPLAEVVDVFDNVWYGYHDLDEERFQHYSARVQELKEKKG